MSALTMASTDESMMRWRKSFVVDELGLDRALLRSRRGTCRARRPPRGARELKLKLRMACSPFLRLHAARRRSAGNCPARSPRGGRARGSRPPDAKRSPTRRAAEVALVVAGDGARARVREEEVPLGVDDDDAVGGALEEVGVALERAQPALGLEAGDGDLLRLVAQRLHARARCGARWPSRSTTVLQRSSSRVAEGEGVLRRAGRARPSAAPRRGWAGWRASEKALLCPSWRTISSSGCVATSGDDERLAAREHLLDLGVLREVDGQVAQLLVVARGDDVADVARLAHEDDAHAVDARDLGDALHDGEEDAAEVEVRRERLGELEHDARVLLLLRRAASIAPRRRSCPRMRATSSTGLNGLRTKSSAPASKAFAISSSASSAVRTTTGRSRVSARARRMRRIW